MFAERQGRAKEGKGCLLFADLPLCTGMDVRVGFRSLLAFILSGKISVDLAMTMASVKRMTHHGISFLHLLSSRTPRYSPSYLYDQNDDDPSMTAYLIPTS